MRVPVIISLAAALLVPACGDDDNSGNNNENENQTGVCGDGTRDADEECDDGTANSDSLPDACRTDCRLAGCGDGVVDASEVCDNGPQNGHSPNPCRADCTLNVCGDGYLGEDEICDDGNTLSGDGCRSDCMQDETRCGDGVVDPGEGCDDAAANSDTVPDACRTDCQPARCGDHVVDSGENCDDGNTADDLTCSADCENLCGDGVFNPHLGEECDQGQQNEVSPSVCRAGCVLTTCGDGYLGGDEECDDGDLNDGDGCSGTCHVEDLWDCAGSPSVCSCAGYNYGDDCRRCVVFVSVDSTALQPDGHGWATAFPGVQEGIDAAHAHGPGCEVWVAHGTYAIFRSGILDTLSLRDGVAVYGGFAGTETAREERDPGLLETVVSGLDPADSGSQVMHVVSAVGTQDATLDGVTVSGGLARADNTDGYGAGLFAYGATIDLIDVTFTANHAKLRGGGAYLYSSAVHLDRCAFFENHAGAWSLLFLEAIGRGGGMYAEYSNLWINGSAFTSNTAYDGGAMFVHDSRYTLTDTLVVSNTASTGAGLFNEVSEFTITRATFARNQASGIGPGGGGMYNDFHALWLDTTVTDSLFLDNYAGYGGAIRDNEGATALIERTIFTYNRALHSGGAHHFENGGTSLRNCVFLHNSADDGGGLSVGDNGYAWVTSSTLFGNHATTYGGAIRTNNNAGLRLTSSIVWQNTAGGGLGQSLFVSPPAWELIIKGSDVEYNGAQPDDYNIDLDPAFQDPQQSGTWTGRIDDPLSGETCLTDNLATWTPDELVGRFVESAGIWYPIHANTATELCTRAVSSAVVANTAYTLHALHPEPDSPCVDAGYGPDALAEDLLGITRFDVATEDDVYPCAGAPDCISWVDMGAYEYTP